jgi:hypothetical protein
VVEYAFDWCEFFAVLAPQFGLGLFYRSSAVLSMKLFGLLDGGKREYLGSAEARTVPIDLFLIVAVRSEVVVDPDGDKCGGSTGDEERRSYDDIVQGLFLLQLPPHGLFHHPIICQWIHLFKATL